MSAQRRQRRRGPVGGHRGPITLAASGPAGTFEGAPVYEGSIVRAVRNPACGDRVMLGIGAGGGLPVAYLVLCPTDGVEGLVAELLDVAAPMAEDHDCGGHT